jgi:hypothetical protein
MLSLLLLVLGALGFLSQSSVAWPVSSLIERAYTDLPRLVIYFQTTHDAEGNPISMLPLIQEQGIALTHLIVCSLHINLNSTIHLNDYPPSDPSFYTLWNETKIMQNAGVTVMGMIGGAAAGSFTNETLDGDDATFEYYYGQLHDVISTYGLQGMDLDVEQSMSQSGIERLVARLYSDFGSGFQVTLAPVGTAMMFSGGTGLSGFNYNALDAAEGPEIAFYNVQFYNGFGDLDNPTDYEDAVNNGYSPSRLVAGQVTSTSNGGGFVDFPTLNQTVIDLRNQYGQIGGIMGWEYFNSLPGGTSAPWEWAQDMTEILRPGMAPEVTVTASESKMLKEAYVQSKTSPNPDSNIKHAPKVNYEATTGK